MSSSEVWRFDHQRDFYPSTQEEVDLEAQREPSFLRAQTTNVYDPRGFLTQMNNGSGVGGTSESARVIGGVYIVDDRGRYIGRINMVEEAKQLRGQSRLQSFFKKMKRKGGDEEKKIGKDGSGVRALWKRSVRGMGRMGDGLVEWLASKMHDKLDVGQDPEEGLLVSAPLAERKRK